MEASFDSDRIPVFSGVKENGFVWLAAKQAAEFDLQRTR
jgi:hypothetical protein